jgi:hypothetical protein
VIEGYGQAEVLPGLQLAIVKGGHESHSDHAVVQILGSSIQMNLPPIEIALPDQVHLRGKRLGD